MFSFSVENAKGEKLQLTNNENYLIERIEGLEPPDITVNRSKIAGYDGTRYNSSTANERAIVLYIDINKPVEKNRLNLYKYFRGKQKLKLYYSNSSLETYIEGYVEQITTNLFAQQEQFQISIICPETYFNAIDEIITGTSKTISLFKFPFSIASTGIPFSEYEKNTETNVINDGTIETGMTITFAARGIVNKPKLFNRVTGKFFGLDYEMQAGDVITVNTRKGKKSVSLLREGVSYNLFNYIMDGSIFLNLDVGDNIFVYEAEVGDNYLDIAFIHRNQFEGV